MAEGLIGVIGGTGLGDELAKTICDCKFRDVRTPFGRPSDRIMVGRIGANRVAFLNRHGQGHKLSPSEVPFAANIFALKKLGVRTVLASGAVGSLREKITPRELVVVDQFIDKTFRRQSSFFAGFGAVHCEMSQPVCGRLGEKLVKTAKRIGVKAHAGGCYVCMEGPQFSTRAESLMHRAWGGDLIGMTAMPEAKLAREAQMCYALIALVSDYDCWRPHDAAGDKQTLPAVSRSNLLQEIIGNLQAATANCLKLIQAVLETDGDLLCDQCSCRKSLDLAVWTDRSKIKPADKKRLKVLFE
jgi:5'-methylthioadenosine phosphorylase